MSRSSRQFVDVFGGLFEALVFLQPADQLGARVAFLLLLGLGPRQQHARLDLGQDCGHHEVFGGQFQAQSVHHFDVAGVLPGDLGDRNIENFEVLTADQVEQQVQRPFERIQEHFQRVGRNVQVVGQFQQRLAANRRKRHLGLFLDGFGRLAGHRPAVYQAQSTNHEAACGGDALDILWPPNAANGRIPRMLYAIVGRDTEDSLAARASARTEHLGRIRALAEDGRLILAGPMPAIDAEDPGPAGFTGSLIVAEFDSLIEARAWADADPYLASAPGIRRTSGRSCRCCRDRTSGWSESGRCSRRRWSPEHLEVIDESHLHVGHAGARDGRGHFRIRIACSTGFSGKPRLARHRMVYAAWAK